MGHQFVEMAAHGDDAAGQSRTSYLYCFRCGTLKSDYRHNGGQTSPNYPLFCSVGRPCWDCQEPACRQPK